MNVADYLNLIASANRRNQSQTLGDLLHPFAQAFIALRQALLSAQGPANDPVKLIKRLSFEDLFANFLIAYLRFVKGVHDPNTNNAKEANESYALLATCYGQALQYLMRSSVSSNFVPALRRLTETLVHLAFHADALSGHSQSRASEARGILTRASGIVAADRSSESPSKRDATLFLANETFKIYFHLNLPRLCEPTIKNITGSGTTHLADFPRADQVTFAYYRGRLDLHNRALREAREHLENAFRLCTTAHYSNRRLILIYLITTSLPLGHFPTELLLRRYNLQDQYLPLLAHLKVGNFKGVLKHLNAWRRWHLAKGTYLLLKEKLEVICWRNLIRKTLWIVDRPAVDKRSSLAFQTLLITGRIAFDDSELDVDDIENICINLIEQGYLKGHISHSTGHIVFSKLPPFFGFHPIASIRPAPVEDEALL